MPPLIAKCMKPQNIKRGFVGSAANLISLWKGIGVADRQPGCLTAFATRGKRGFNRARPAAD